MRWVVQANTEECNETVRVTCAQSDWPTGLCSSCKLASARKNETVRVTCAQSDWPTGIGSSCKLISEIRVTCTKCHAC